MHTHPTPSLSTHGGTLGQLLRGCYLDIEVFGLRLPSGFDEPLQYLVRGKERELEGHRQRTKSKRQILVGASGKLESDWWNVP